MLPEKIGKYRVLRRLGQGAMGDVYLGEDPYIGRQVALKVLRQADLESTQRFLHEARIVGAFSHPSIVLLLEFGFEGEEPFLAMEFLPGRSLDDWLSEPHALPEQLPIVRSLCEALEYAHAHGVLHRDVKPGNVQVLPDGHCKLMDFGIARAPAGRLTATGTVMGTPNYMAPEILHDAAYSERSDVYSAGVLFYEMFSGANPFKAQTIAACLRNVLELEPRPLQELRPDLPRELCEVLMACLRKAPEQRPASLQPLLLVVKALEGGTAVPRSVLDETRALEGQARPASHAARSRVVRRATGLATLLAAVAGLAVWLRRPAPLPQVQPSVQAPSPTPLAMATPTPAAGLEASYPSPRPHAPSSPALRASVTPRPEPSAPASVAEPSLPAPTPAAATPAPSPASATAEPAPRPVASVPASAPEAGVTLDELLPRFVRRGASTRLELRGRGFRSTLRVVVLHGGRAAPGFQVGGQRVVDAGHISATLSIDGDVALDTYTVVLQDGARVVSNGATLEVGL